MPAQQAAVAGGGQGQQQPPQKSNAIFGILRMIAMWYMFKTFFGGGGQQKKLTREETFLPHFPKGTSLDMSVYLSESPTFRDFTGIQPVWQESDIQLGLDSERKLNITYRPSQAVQRNGSVYLHTFFVPSGLALSPADPFYQNNSVFGRSLALNKYLPKPRNKTGVNLLATSQAEQEEARKQGLVDKEKPREYLSYLKPSVSIALLDDATAYPANAVPDHIKPYLDPNFEDMTYYPTIFFNEFWTLRENLIPINETLKEATIALDLTQMGLWKFTIFSQVEKSFEMQRDFGAQADGESDELKRVLLEGNPYFLGITFFVSILHSVFDMLAFKNDIGFWKGKKNVEGLSVRTVGINCVCQVIIFLYLVEEDTSYLVLFSSGLGLIIEFWKLTQAMSISVDWSRGYPTLKFADKSSYTQNKTAQYDAEAMRYLSYALYPLVIGYAIYALLYESHRSWYSWILNSLVGAVYTFGFILMCPQLYLNYRMKSVAHLPWRQMTYKFLNTIIDDLFAFVIKMPTLHRLSVFRDDIVFLIYMYQRWIYRVDKKRANEFGFSAEPDAAEQAALDEKAHEDPSSSSALQAVEPKKEK